MSINCEMSCVPTDGTCKRGVVYRRCASHPVFFKPHVYALDTVSGIVLSVRDGDCAKFVEEDGARLSGLFAKLDLSDLVGAGATSVRDDFIASFSIDIGHPVLPT